MKKSVLAALSSFVFLTACSSDGDISNVVWRKVTWESYMQGEDIKHACEAGGENQYRYVYNANRAVSVLMYNWTDEGGLTFGRLDRAVNGSTLLNQDVLETLFDPVENFHDPEDLEKEKLLTLVQEDIGKEGVAVGKAVTSADHFLAVSSCIDGQFDLKLFSQSQLQADFSDALDTLLDMTTTDQDRPVLPETKALTNRKQLMNQSDRDTFMHYRIELGEDELQFGMTYPFK